MLKKSITYENLNGETVTETHYFHLSKAELIELELSHEGGFDTYLKRLVEAGNGADIVNEMKKLILMSYGTKSEDGRKFDKTEEMVDEFKKTEAWSALFMEIATETGKAVEFVKGLMPAGIEKELDQLLASQEAAEEPEDTRPAWEKEDRDPTTQELANMDRKELMEVYKKKAQKL